MMSRFFVVFFLKGMVSQGNVLRGWSGECAADFTLDDFSGYMLLSRAV
jgi:hypothetical protein